MSYLPGLCEGCCIIPAPNRIVTSARTRTLLQVPLCYVAFFTSEGLGLELDVVAKFHKVLSAQCGVCAAEIVSWPSPSASTSLNPFVGLKRKRKEQEGTGSRDRLLQTFLRELSPHTNVTPSASDAARPSDFRRYQRGDDVIHILDDGPNKGPLGHPRFEALTPILPARSPSESGGDFILQDPRGALL